jgi:hypothetical protein
VISRIEMQIICRRIQNATSAYLWYENDFDDATSITETGVFHNKGCATWCLRLREANRLRVFQTRVARKILGPTMEGTMTYGTVSAASRFVLLTRYRWTRL